MEFTSKAKCDGTKVVLEPSGIIDIINALNAKKTNEKAPVPVVEVRGPSFFPRTEQSDKNIEVLSAWRSITSNPHFKVGLFNYPGYRISNADCRTSTLTS